MPRYMMHVFCSECLLPHPGGIVIETAEEIDPKQSVADIYDGRDLPQQIAMLINNSFRCRPRASSTGRGITPTCFWSKWPRGT